MLHLLLRLLNLHIIKKKACRCLKIRIEEVFCFLLFGHHQIYDQMNFMLLKFVFIQIIKTDGCQFEFSRGFQQKCILSTLPYFSDAIVQQGIFLLDSAKRPKE